MVSESVDFSSTGCFSSPVSSRSREFHHRNDENLFFFCAFDLETYRLLTIVFANNVGVDLPMSSMKEPDKKVEASQEDRMTVRQDALCKKLRRREDAMTTPR